MTLIIPPGYAQILSKYTATGDPETMITTFGYGTGGTSLTQTQLDTIAGFWETFMVPKLATNWQWLGLEALIGQDGGPPVHLDAIRRVNGVGGTNSLPQNNAVLLKKRTALGGRHGRGRMFIPGGLYDNTVDQIGIISSSEVADWNTRIGGFVSAIGGMALLHNSASGGGAVPPPSAVTSVVCDVRIATQRRRLR